MRIAAVQKNFAKKILYKIAKRLYICKNKTKPQKRRTKYENDIVKKLFDQPKHKAETKVEQTEQNLQSKLKKSTKSPKKLFWPQELPWQRRQAARK